MTQPLHIDRALQPKSEEFDFDLEIALSSIVGIRVDVPENAFTASSLGLERSGHGVLIKNSGLILTIGYLTIEADTIWIIDEAGKAINGHLVAYDQETGFSLVQALGPLTAHAISLGKSSEIQIGEEVMPHHHFGDMPERRGGDLLYGVRPDSRTAWSFSNQPV